VFATDDFEEAHVRPKPGRVLIVGSRVYQNKPDRRKLHADCVGVDMQAGEGVDRVADLEHEDVGQFAHIECMSVLEHVRRPWLMAANLERMLVPEGTIYVTVPFVWRVHGYPDDYWRFTASGVRQLFPSIKWTAEAYSHRRLTDADNITWVKHEDWPHCARTEVCMFGRK
jgi:hypothetical protein